MIVVLGFTLVFAALVGLWLVTALLVIERRPGPGVVLGLHYSFTIGRRRLWYGIKVGPWCITYVVWRRRWYFARSPQARCACDDADI